jgi:hypothetical protein
LADFFPMEGREKNDESRKDESSIAEIAMIAARRIQH